MVNLVDSDGRPLDIKAQNIVAETALAVGEGSSASINGFSSGWGCKATAGSSTAFGDHTEATGFASHAEGGRTIANGIHQHVFGVWNALDTLDKNGVGKYVEMVGAGKESGRKNIRTLTWGGDEELAGAINGLYISKKSTIDYNVTQSRGCLGIPSQGNFIASVNQSAASSTATASYASLLGFGSGGQGALLSVHPTIPIAMLSGTQGESTNWSKNLCLSEGGADFSWISFEPANLMIMWGMYFTGGAGSKSYEYPGRYKFGDYPLVFLTPLLRSGADKLDWHPYIYGAELDKFTVGNPDSRCDRFYFLAIGKLGNWPKS